MSPTPRGDSKQTIWRRVGALLYRWRATLAVLAGCGVLLWHLLACVESPMAFSPQGDLAFTTVGLAAAPGAEGPAGSPTEEEHEVSRLFVLPKGERTLRLIEETDDHYLCAPAYSPDGKTLSYLRVPRRKERPQQELPPAPQQQSDKSEDSSPPALVSSEGYQFEDFSLPSVSQMEQFFRELKDQPRAEVTLVARDAASGEVRATTKLDLPLPESDEDEAAIGTYARAFGTYALGSMQYGPEGEWIYPYDGQLVLAVNPAGKQVRLLAAGVFSAALSPDGQVMATLSEKSIGLVETDGRRALFARFEQDLGLVSAKGFAWLDDDTLATLAGEGDDRPLSLLLVRRDGTVSKSIKLPINETDDYFEELAVSPDRKRIAIATQTVLYLLDPDGNVVSQWKEEGISACSPTFSPDSQQLACKLLPEGDESYPTAIVFFSLDGKELFRIPLPQQ